MTLSRRELASNDVGWPMNRMKAASKKTAFLASSTQLQKVYILTYFMGHYAYMPDGPQKEF